MVTPHAKQHTTTIVQVCILEPSGTFQKSETNLSPIEKSTHRTINHIRYFSDNRFPDNQYVQDTIRDDSRHIESIAGNSECDKSNALILENGYHRLPVQPRNNKSTTTDVFSKTFAVNKTKNSQVSDRDK